MPGWLKTWLFIAAIVGGAALLALGFIAVLALLLLVLVPLAIVAWALQKFGPAKRSGPTVIEGEAAVIEERALTEQEKALLASSPVWVVWYEDQFHVGAERDSFGVGVCFSVDDAKALIARSGGKMLTPGYDGHEIHGPENPLTTPLFGAQRAEILGAIVDRLASGSREPIAMRI